MTGSGGPATCGKCAKAYSPKMAMCPYCGTPRGRTPLGATSAAGAPAAGPPSPIEIVKAPEDAPSERVLPPWLDRVVEVLGDHAFFFGLPAILAGLPLAVAWGVLGRRRWDGVFARVPIHAGLIGSAVLVIAALVRALGRDAGIVDWLLVPAAVLSAGCAFAWAWRRANAR